MEKDKEMVLNADEILVTQGTITFHDFETLKLQALELAQEIATVEVNQENIKVSKKLLAEVNRRLKDLEDRRIRIKKVMLEPYVLFESQVKEIVGIVREADELVRQQVKDIEETERMAKQDHLQDLFQKRIVHYSFRDLFTFFDFLKPKHLNKTTSIQAVEDEMIAFLNKVTADMKAIESMPNAQQILSAYIGTKDLAAALISVERENERKSQIEASGALKNKDAQISYLVTIECESENDLRFIKAVMMENAIEYKIDKIEKVGF